MSKTAMIRARMEPVLKNEVEKILHLLGLSCTDAINLFYQQVKLNRGLPFEVKLPNNTTLKAIDAAVKGKKIKKAKNVNDLFNQLGI